MPARRLDTLAEGGDIAVAETTVVWVDAQGHEGQILAGAQTLLGRVPMVLEFWPYGLRRAGGYDLFLESVARWPVVFDIRYRPATRVAQGDLAALGARLERERSFTDLLLIPR